MGRDRRMVERLDYGSGSQDGRKKLTVYDH